MNKSIEPLCSDSFSDGRMIKLFCNDTNLVNNSHKTNVNLQLAKYVAILQAIVSVYIFFVLTYYFYKKRAFNRNSKSNQLSVLASGFCVLACLDRLAELWIKVISCYAYHLMATLMYGIGLGLVYTTLWLRQRKLYSDKLLKHTVTSTSRRISSAIIVVIYFLIISVFALFVTILQFETLYPPCHIIWYPLSALLPLLIFLILTCFFLQLILFSLIVNPLKRGNGICIVLLCSNSKNDVFVMLKRLAVCACACVCSTIFLSIAILLDATEIICIYWGNLISLDLIICILATIFSYQDWDQRLLPLCPRIKRRRRKFRNSVVLDETSARIKLRRSSKKTSTSKKQPTNCE